MNMNLLKVHEDINEEGKLALDYLQEASTKKQDFINSVFGGLGDEITKDELVQSMAPFCF